MEHGIIVPPGEGKALFSPSGMPQQLKAGEADTHGAYSLWESVIRPGEGAPVHVHLDNEEAFYLLEGELRLVVGGREQVIHPGAFALVPRGVSHAFTNPAATSARMLTIMSPPMDRYRAALTDLLAALPGDSPRNVTALDPAVLRAVQARHGVREGSA